MKKIITLISTVLILVLIAAGCKAAATNGEKKESNNKNDKINVVSREDGSGTRGAFIELFEIEEKDENGNKIDNTIDTAEFINSTSVMMQTIAGDPSAIGYISLGSLNDTVTALNIDGVAPSIKTIKDGSYAISRPFNIATKGELSDVAKDFIDYILSTDGQDIVEEKGYIRQDNTKEYSGKKPSGKIVVAGSTSVTPVMEALKEAYEKINTGAEIEIQSNDSTTGMNSVIEGICDIGMASRDLKDSELAEGLEKTEIATDGIAVIVNNDNSIKDMTKEQIKNIYTGKTANWSEIK